MFSPHIDDGYRQALPGIMMKTLCYGGLTLMTEFVMDAGSLLPLHSHPYEQTGYLVKGRVRLSIRGVEHDVHPGDSWCIGMNIEHGAAMLEDSLAVEVFSPRRDEYIPKD
ncbi:MAG TPA: cupin domain-containing protein [Candidatus Bathyarchaeia archaeon]|nr:cupin domain-containing protein [Candidatus Bathyarchaeia archaeon]